MPRVKSSGIVWKLHPAILPQKGVYNRKDYKLVGTSFLKDMISSLEDLSGKCEEEVQQNLLSPFNEVKSTATSKSFAECLRFFLVRLFGQNSHNIELEELPKISPDHATMWIVRIYSQNIAKETLKIMSSATYKLRQYLDDLFSGWKLVKHLPSPYPRGTEEVAFSVGKACLAKGEKVYTRICTCTEEVSFIETATNYERSDHQGSIKLLSWQTTRGVVAIWHTTIRDGIYDFELGLFA